MTMAVVGGAVYTPQAKAVDPISWAILAPFAVKAAEKAHPYVITGFFSGMRGFLKMGIDVIEVFQLPIGILGCTVGAPFGFFKPGVRYTIKGFIAPFKLAFHAVMLPVMFCGIDVP